MSDIGAIIRQLETCNPSAPVHFDMGWAVPTTIDSSRGSYDEAALGYKAYHHADEPTHPTVQDVLAELRAAVDGRTFQGWKGGEYSYNFHTPLWVDNPGGWSATRIVSVDGMGYIVYLVTERQP